MQTDNNKKVSLEEGISLLRSFVSMITDTEKVPVRKALGRTIAQDLTATHDQPPFARSPFDGYAIRSEDSKGASVDTPVTLKVIGEVDAGHVFRGTVSEGRAVRIMTGAPIPDGADAVIKQEETDYGEDIVNIFREMRYNQNNCAAGEDYKKGAVLLPDRSYIGPVEIGILASTGNTEVSVYRRPKALLISTGDEIMMPGEPLLPGRIYDSNLFTLEAILTEWGVDVIHTEKIEDDPAAASSVIMKYTDDVDLLISSGGVSVGKKDIMHDVFDFLGVERIFWKIGIKPGAAMLTGTYRGRQVLALSGNPYAAFIDLHMVVRPVINALNGNDHLEMLRETVVLMDDYDRPSRIRRFVRAYVREGKAYIEGHTGGNGDIYSGHGINAILDIPAGSDKLSAGDKVTALLL
ncbi:MAG: molybdopterin molybdotransferase MoeA [Clostridiales bacterium]|nr:molybdopterin molybdotransferase MoeA [Clostridiales bacterium]